MEKKLILTKINAIKSQNILASNINITKANNDKRNKVFLPSTKVAYCPINYLMSYLSCNVYYVFLLHPF